MRYILPNLHQFSPIVSTFINLSSKLSFNFSPKVLSLAYKVETVSNRPRTSRVSETFGKTLLLQDFFCTCNRKDETLGKSDSSSRIARMPRGFSNMVMQDWRSIPKSTISQSIPSFTYSSCSSTNLRRWKISQNTI